jgi:hypothetical protein
VALSCFFSLRADAKGRPVDYALAGAAFGVATALKYLPIVEWIPLTISLVRPAASARCTTPTRFFWAGGGFALAVGLGTLPCLIHPSEFWRDLGFLATYRKPTHVELLSALALDWMPVSLGLATSIASALALGLALIRGPRSARLTGAWLATYLLALLAARAFFARHALPAIPLALALLAAGIGRVTPRGRPLIRGGIIVLATLGFSLESLPRDFAITRLFQELTTFQLARKFLDERIERGVVVSTPCRAVASTLASDRVQAWDPPTLAREKLWILVEARHPLPCVAQVASSPRVLFPKRSDVKPVFEVVGLGPAGERDARFETRDHFFFPWEGISSAVRGGPDLWLHVIEPARDANGNPVFRAHPRLSLQGTPPVLTIDHDSNERVIALYARVARGSTNGSIAWTEPLWIDPATRTIEVGALGLTGTHYFSVCALYDSGSSDWAPPLEATLGRR